MLRLINGIVKDVNRPSFAFLSSDDWIAERVAKDFHIKTVKITRPRKVNQSMISAVLSTLWTLSRCIYLILCGKVPRVDLVRYDFKMSKL